MLRVAVMKTPRWTLSRTTCILFGSQRGRRQQQSDRYNAVDKRLSMLHALFAITKPMIQGRWNISQKKSAYLSEQIHRNAFQNCARIIIFRGRQDMWKMWQLVNTCRIYWKHWTLLKFGPRATRSSMLPFFGVQVAYYLKGVSISPKYHLLQYNIKCHASKFIQCSRNACTAAWWSQKETFQRHFKISVLMSRIFWKRSNFHMLYSSKCQR